MKARTALLTMIFTTITAVPSVNAALPDPGMEIDQGRTALLITDPHKVYGPETNDLVLQLRKRGIDKIILGGMSANLCTESHMRELIEQGFEVAVVSDATAAAIVEEGGGYQAA